MITILAFTLWSNIFVTGCFTYDKPVTLSSNNYRSEQHQVPSGWRKIDAYGKFSFYLPPNMWDTGIRGIDDLHGEYTNGRIHLSFDYEPNGVLSYDRRTRAFGKDFQEIELQVDGRKAYLFLYQSSDFKKRRTYNADLFVGDLPKRDVLLHMWTMSWSAKRIETVKIIFQTIRFCDHSTDLTAGRSTLFAFQILRFKSQTAFVDGKIFCRTARGASVL